MPWRYVLITFIVLALTLGVLAPWIAKHPSVAAFHLAATAIIVGVLVIAAILSLPTAYVVIAIVYLLRPEQRAPSTNYSIDQGTEAGQRDRRGN